MLQAQGNKLTGKIFFNADSDCSKVCDLLTQCPWGDCTQKAQEGPMMPFAFICEEHSPDCLLDDPPTVIKSKGFSDIAHTGEQIRKHNKPRSILCFRRHYKQRQNKRTTVFRWKHPLSQRGCTQTHRHIFTHG